MTTESAVESARCPLCGGDNRCTMAAGRPDESCWCAGVTLAAAMLDRIPPGLRGGACVCPSCAAALAAQGA
jgi:hypothetical protein